MSPLRLRGRVERRGSGSGRGRSGLSGLADGQVAGIGRATRERAAVSDAGDGTGVCTPETTGVWRGGSGAGAARRALSWAGGASSTVSGQTGTGLARPI